MKFLFELHRKPSTKTVAQLVDVARKICNDDKTVRCKSLQEVKTLLTGLAALHANKAKNVRITLWDKVKLYEGSVTISDKLHASQLVTIKKLTK